MTDCVIYSFEHGAHGAAAEAGYPVPVWKWDGDGGYAALV